MSINDFLTKTNVQLLWEVIIDDDLFKNQSKEIVSQINNIFYNNLRGFHEIEKNNFTNLMNMNKKFIGFILNQSYNIINFNKKSTKSQPLITSADLQSERISKFEKDLSEKQTEFSNAMTLPVPPVPKFQDDKLDEPISEIELEIKKVLDQRNYDIEQLNKTLSNTNADSWLKPQETSVKSEKLTPPTNKSISNNNSNNSNNNSIKYIKIDNQNIENTIIKKDIIDLEPKKHITWKDNVENENISLTIFEDNDNDNYNETNIFKKLKKITTDVIPEKTSSDRMDILEDKIEGLYSKLDIILQILQKNY
jgi:hypothetical protein